MLLLEQMEGQLTGTCRWSLPGLGDRPAFEHLAQRHGVRWGHARGRCRGREVGRLDEMACIASDHVSPCGTVGHQALEKDRPRLRGAPVDQHAQLAGLSIHQGHDSG